MMGRRTMILFATLFFIWNESHVCLSSPSLVYVQLGAGFFQSCECNSLPGCNVNTIQWMNQDNKVIKPRHSNEPVYVEAVDDSVNLYIYNVTQELLGDYKCVTHLGGKTLVLKERSLAYETITLQAPEKTKLILGHEAVIRCKVYAAPNAKPTDTEWYKDDDPKQIGQNREHCDNYCIGKVGLKISKVRMQDKGKYTCRIFDTESTFVATKQIDVEIITKPTIKDIVVSSNELTVGETLYISCVADGTPEPTYKLERIDEVTNQTSTFSWWKLNNNSFSIEGIKADDQGTYQCIAENEAGVDRRNVSILVNVPPHVTSFPNITVQAGQNVQLICYADGRPPPNVTIIPVRMDSMNEIDVYEIMENSTTIENVQKEHMGTYVCNATNRADYDLDYMFLNVEYPPFFLTIEETVWGWNAKLVNFSCAHDSNPPSNITWRYQSNEIPSTPLLDINDIYFTSRNIDGSNCIIYGTPSKPLPYGSYEMKATNPLGVATKVVFFREGHVPGVITNASVLWVSYTSATFFIEDPKGEDRPHTQGFTAEYDGIDNYNITDIHNNRTWSIDRPFTIDTLKPNTTYFIRFAAINEVGYGNWSDFLEFHTPEPSIPNIPEWLTETDLVNVTSFNQEIKWSPAEANGAPIEYYSVKYCGEEELDCYKEVRVPGGGDLKLDISLMEYNTTYFINLTAHNSAGDSMPAYLSVVMLAEPLPSPSLLSAGALIGISIVVVFVCLFFLDLLLLMWRKQGIMASCCKKKKDDTNDNLRIRDKKGLLKDNREPEETLRPDNRHKEFEYNKTTGIITGRHSAV